MLTGNDTRYPAVTIKLYCTSLLLTTKNVMECSEGLSMKLSCNFHINHLEV